MEVESAIARSIVSRDSEKTYIDKLLARKDVNALRELIKKTELTRSDILEILYLLSGTESKLLNYGDWDRYVILKFFVWLREFVKIAEFLYDYEDKLEKSKVKLTPRTKEILANNKRLISHNLKFLVDLYLNIGRTTLSVGATGLLEFLKNKYEVVYPNQAAIMPTGEPAKKGFLGIRGL